MSKLINYFLVSTQSAPVQLEIYSSPGALNGATWDLATTMITMTIALAITALVIYVSWTRIVDTFHVLRRGAAARDLFLKMRIKVDGEPGGDSYLRYVDRREADLVSTTSPTKGQRITLLMGFLSGFPDADLSLSGEVIKVRPLEGSPAKFLVVVKFGPLDQKVEQPLLAYIHSLVTPARVYL